MKVATWYIVPTYVSTGYRCFILAMLWILIGFNADPDPLFLINADPDPGF